MNGTGMDRGGRDVEDGACLYVRIAPALSNTHDVLKPARLFFLVVNREMPYT
jgi:hypothetical protein